MADTDYYFGTWKIIKCQTLEHSSESTGIEGTEFTLDESGDVTWKIPEGTEAMPFFKCETYQVYSNDDLRYLRFFGAIVGHVIEFRVDSPKSNTIQLTYEGWCMLECDKVSPSNSVQFQPTPYSFLCALVDGYFSDLKILANNGKEFKVHKTILKLGNSSLDWSVSPCPLSNLSEEVVYTILHYLYSESLPDQLDDETARSCLAATGDMPGFDGFRDLCQLYLKNNALLDQILTLVEEIHAIGDLIIDCFSGQTDVLSCSSSSDSDDDVNFANNPAKLRYVIIQALRESAVAGAKILVLCDLFSKRKNELCHAERHELIEYLKTRLPDCMKQLHRLLEVIKIAFGNLTPLQRMEIASYFVADIEHVLDVVFEFVTEIKTAVKQIINASSSKSEKNGATLGDEWKSGVGKVLGKSLKDALHMRELLKLKKFHARVLVSFVTFMQKKQSFSDMSSEVKNRSVAKNLEQFIEELPVFMLRTKEMTDALDEKLTFKEWKYWFKWVTSKIAWFISRIACHREMMNSVIHQLDNIVSREQFTQCLTQLNLLDPPPVAVASPSSSVKYTPLQNNEKCNEVKSFHESPIASESKLAQNAVSFLKKGLDTDMSFEIVMPSPDASRSTKGECRSPVGAQAPDIVKNGKVHIPNGPQTSVATENGEVHYVTIKAHCIIITSRCDWFRRALLSGMKESINKQIIIHDTTPQLFLIFLEYLYGGQVDTGQLSTEQLADLMQLSDRYEVDCLKQISEDALKNLIDEDSALFLLGIADQFNARALRTAALEFIALNKDIVKSEVFYDLPEDLQSEVEEMITWVELRNSQRNEELTGPRFLNHDSSHSSVSSSLLEIEEIFSTANLSSLNAEQASDSSSLEDLPLTQDSAQLEACVAQLRDIVGESVPRDELVRVSLAADYDVNRALNFFFSKT